MSTNEEEVPELIRVANPSVGYGLSFNFAAASELLRRKPEQVVHVTYQQDQPLRQDQPLQLLSLLGWACYGYGDDPMQFLRTVRDIDSTRFMVLQTPSNDTVLDGEIILNADGEMIRFVLDIFIRLDFSTAGFKLHETNFNPLTTLCCCYDEEIRQCIQDIESGERTVTGSTVDEDDLGLVDHDDPDWFGFWDRIKLVAKAFYHKTTADNLSDGKTFRLVHALAGIDWAPPNLLKLLTTAFPETLNGNLPIHVAADGVFDSYRISAIHDSDSSDGNNDDWVADPRGGYQKTTIDILLAGFPESAKMPNRQGKLPLELALLSVRKWRDGGIGSLLEANPEAAQVEMHGSVVSGGTKLALQVAIEENYNHKDLEDAVEALLKANPAAVDEIDKSTKLPMYMLAASLNRGSVSVIYSLMRASPMARCPTLKKKKASCSWEGSRPHKRSKITGTD